MSRTLQFDQFLAERNREEIHVELMGKTYRIPGRIPALVPLRMARAEKVADTARRNSEYSRLVFEAADAMFGEEQMDEIAGTGISAQELALLVQKCFEVINGTEEEEGEELTDEDSRRTLPAEQGKKLT